MSGEPNWSGAKIMCTEIDQTIEPVWAAMRVMGRVFMRLSSRPRMAGASICVPNYMVDDRNDQSIHPKSGPPDAGTDTLDSPIERNSIGSSRPAMNENF
jgi:hypothetical protein